MSYSWSPSANGFYNSASRAVAPADAIAITDTLYASAIAALNSGGSVSVVNGQLVVTQKPAPTLTQLASRLVRAARVATNSITSQIAATQTHLAGYQSAANMVRAANGVPAADPDKTAFANLATAIGLPPATLASVVLAMDATSVGNLAILMTIETAAASATATAANLATALSAFEAALAAEVTTLNAAGLTTAITAPAAITIVGINA